MWIQIHMMSCEVSQSSLMSLQCVQDDGLGGEADQGELNISSKLQYPLRQTVGADLYSDLHMMSCEMHDVSHRSCGGQDGVRCEMSACWVLIDKGDMSCVYAVKCVGSFFVDTCV